MKIRSLLKRSNRFALKSRKVCCIKTGLVRRRYKKRGGARRQNHSIYTPPKIEEESKIKQAGRYLWKNKVPIILNTVKLASAIVSAVAANNIRRYGYMIPNRDAMDMYEAMAAAPPPQRVAHPMNREAALFVRRYYRHPRPPPPGRLF